MTNIDNLVSAWIAAEAETGKTFTQATRGMGRHIHMPWLTVSRVREWEAGARTIPQDAVAYMIAVALPWILEQESIRPSARAIDRITARLSPPERS